MQPRMRLVSLGVRVSHHGGSRDCCPTDRVEELSGQQKFSCRFGRRLFFSFVLVPGPQNDLLKRCRSSAGLARVSRKTPTPILLELGLGNFNTVLVF